MTSFHFIADASLSSSVLRNLILPVGFLANKCLFPVLFAHHYHPPLLAQRELYGVAPCGAQSSTKRSRSSKFQTVLLRLDSTTFRRVEQWESFVLQFFRVEGNIWTCPHVIQSHTFLRLKQHVCHNVKNEIEKS